MKISVSQTALNPGGEEPKNLLVRTKRSTKTESAINAEKALVFDRGNSAITASFEIEEKIQALLPADLNFETGENKKISLPQCVLSEIRISVDGSVTNSRYEFKARKANYE